MPFVFQNRVFRARLCLALAMAIVGSSVVVGAYVNAALSVPLSLWLRFVLASAVMVPLLMMREGGIPRLPARDWAILFLQAGCGGFLFNTLLLKGMEYVDPAMAGILTATGPACVLLVSFCMLGERFTGRGAVAVCFAVLGIVILQLIPSETGGSGAFSSENVIAGAVEGRFGLPSVLSGGVWGTVLVLGAVVAEAMFLMLGKRLSRPISPLAASTMLCVFGAVQFTPQAVPELLSQQMAAFGLVGWSIIVWYALGITVGAYLLWFSGVAHIPGAEAGVYTGIMPLSAIVLSATLLGTAIRWQHIVGCVAVLLGIVIAAGQTAAARKLVYEEN